MYIDSMEDLGSANVGVYNVAREQRHLIKIKR